MLKREAHDFSRGRTSHVRFGGSGKAKYVITRISHMPNMTLSVPQDVYERMKRRRDVKWSEVARRAILERLEHLEGPVGFHTSTTELKRMIAEAGVELERIPIHRAIGHYKRARKLEWKRTSTIQAN